LSFPLWLMKSVVLVLPLDGVYESWSCPGTRRSPAQSVWLSFGENYPPSKKVCDYANFADVTLKQQEPTDQSSDICDDHHVRPAVESKNDSAAAAG
jgi:hypothetical protein